MGQTDQNDDFDNINNLKNDKKSVEKNKFSNDKDFIKKESSSTKSFSEHISDDLFKLPKMDLEQIAADLLKAQKDPALEQTILGFKKLALMEGITAQIIKEEPQMNDFFSGLLAEKIPNAKPIIKRFSGACQIMCNFIIMYGKDNPQIALDKLKNIYEMASSNQELVQNLKQFLQSQEPQSVMGVNTKMVFESSVEAHPLKFSFRLIIDIILNKLFGIYPCSIVPFLSQKNLVLQGNDGDPVFNSQILDPKLSSLKQGEYIQFSWIERDNKGVVDQGHAMLIWKDGDKYYFFDPNHSFNGQTQSFDRVEGLLNHLNNTFLKGKDASNLKQLSLDYCFVDAKELIGRNSGAREIMNKRDLQPQHAVGKSSVQEQSPDETPAVKKPVIDKGKERD